MFDLIASHWLPLIVLAIVTLAARVFSRTWIAPAPFVGAVWLFFASASLLVVDYPVPSRGVWMLVELVVAVQAGALIASAVLGEPDPLAPLPVPDTRFVIRPCRTWGLICTVVALAGCLHFLLISLDEFGLSFTPIGVLEVGAHWTLLRYEDVVEPWSVRLLVMWLHPAALMGGLLFACSPSRRDRFIAVITSLPAVLYGLLTGSRAAILIGLTCWGSGYLAAVVVRTPQLSTVFTWKRVLLLSLVPVCGLVIFASIDAVRDSSWVHTVMIDVREQKLENYIFGSPAAFADWYAHADSIAPEWGARTFAGEFDLLQIKPRIVGRYLETSNVVGTENTNVYTLFRGLIEDFTEVGAVIIAACFGLLAGYLFQSRSTHVLSAWLGLSIVYAVVIYSPIVSFFSYNGPTLAWLMAGLLLLAARHGSSPASLVALKMQEASSR